MLERQIQSISSIPFGPQLTIHPPQKPECLSQKFPNFNPNSTSPANPQNIPIPTWNSGKYAERKKSYLTGRDKLQRPKGGLQVLCVALQVEESAGDRSLQLGGVLPRRRVEGDLVDSSHFCSRRSRRDGEDGLLLPLFCGRSGEGLSSNKTAFAVVCPCGIRIAALSLSPHAWPFPVSAVCPIRGRLVP